MKSNKKNLRMAVIGLGRGKSHVNAIAESKGGDLVALCDLKSDLVKSIADKHGANAYTDYREMFEKENLDVVDICTPSGLHCDMALEAAKYDINVMSEKPLDIDLAKIDKTVKTFSEKGLKLGCIFQNRFTNVNQRKKQIVDSGKLGRLAVANAHIKWYRSQEYYDKNDGWHGTWDLDGGGSLMNQSVHTIDLMQWMMGPVSSVIGLTKIWSHDIETEDMGVALVKFRNGALGTIIGSTATYPGFGTKIEVHGIDGGFSNGKCFVRSEDGKEELSLDVDPSETEEGMADPNAISSNTTVQQIQDFIYAVQDDRKPLVAGDEARHAVEIILAIYESSRRGGEEIFLPLEKQTVINMK